MGSPRLEAFAWTLSVAEGPTPTAEDFVEFASGEGADKNAELAVLSLKKDGPLGNLVKRAGEAVTGYPEQFTATLQLKVTSPGPNGSVTGTFRKTFHLRQDNDMLEGFPLYLDASGESSPKVSDLDGDGEMEIILATADGRVHAIDRSGAELPGFPVESPVIDPLNDDVCDVSPAQCHQMAPAYHPYNDDPAFPPGSVRSTITSTVALGDLDGDGSAEKDLVALTFDGAVLVWDADGNPLEGFPVFLDKSKVSNLRVHYVARMPKGRKSSGALPNNDLRTPDSTQAPCSPILIATATSKSLVPAWTNGFTPGTTTANPSRVGPCTLETTVCRLTTTPEKSVATTAASSPPLR